MKMTKEQQIEILMAALQECQEYFDDESDVVDGDDGQPEPNREMSMSMMIDAAIAQATNKSIW
jgi:hypothetical protein